MLYSLSRGCPLPCRSGHAAQCHLLEHFRKHGAPCTRSANFVSGPQSLPGTSFVESLQPFVVQRPLRPSCRPPIAGLLQALSSCRRYAASIACICQAQVCTGLRGAGRNMVRQVGEGCRADCPAQVACGQGACTRCPGCILQLRERLSPAASALACLACIVCGARHSIVFCQRMTFKCRTGACGRSVNSFAQLILMQLGSSSETM